MIQLVIEVEGRPATKGSTASWRHPATGKIITRQQTQKRLGPWTRAAVLQAEIAMSREGIAAADRPPLREAVEVLIEARFSRPLTHYVNRDGRRLRPDAPTWHTVYPDGDKIGRAVLDAMTRARVWRDDGQVARHVVVKRWADPGEGEGVKITLKEMGGKGHGMAEVG